MAQAYPAVLVVEDDPGVRALIALQLQSSGYTVSEAGSAMQALDFLNAGEGFDLVVSDIRLPGGMTGVELAEAARVVIPGVRVLLTSGDPGGQPADGRFPLLAKPFRRCDLLAAIEATFIAA